jgi:hypothetical protein
MVAKNGRIVVTASSVHDPDSLGELRVLRRRWVTSRVSQVQWKKLVDGKPFNSDKAYKDCKVSAYLHV